MERGKQVANSTTERWKMKENRNRIVKSVVDELITHVCPNLNVSLPELVQIVKLFEEKVNASAKTEYEYISLIAMRLKSIRARYGMDAEAKNLITSPSASATFQDHQVAMPIDSSPSSINQPSISKGSDNAVEQQTNIALEGFGESINSPEISATEAFGAGSKSNTQRISPLIKESNNQNQVSRKPTLDSEEPSPAMQRLIKVLTSISPEALRAAVGEIKEVVHSNDEVVDELGLTTFPEGYKKPRSFVATAFDTSSICGSMLDGFNQFTETAESNLDSFTMKGKPPKTVENQNLLGEIKEINNRLFDCEVVIAEKENVESAVGLAAEQSEGLLVKIMYNAVTINQNLVSKFTSDKKSLMKPLRLLIPASYPSSSLVILDELPLKVSDDLRALFERAKAKLKLNLQSINVPWLIKDVARAWEHCARESILEYAVANGGGTFTSMHRGWEVC
ncbi:mediator of RNA polymerase II transcription subunit 15a [Trifolium repens]|nr:mediator of RNA polymerase II transcription subunit 15a [Trifolium repens]